MNGRFVRLLLHRFWMEHKYPVDSCGLLHYVPINISSNELAVLCKKYPDLKNSLNDSYYINDNNREQKLAEFCCS